MTVRQLIEQLSKVDPELTVIVGKDSDSFSPLEMVDHPQMYLPEAPWCGDIILEEDWDPECWPPEEALPCVVLWPVN